MSLAIICVCFDTKFRSGVPQVLFRSFRAKTTQSTTAITSIVASLRSQNKAKPKFLYPILRIEILRIAESRAIFSSLRVLAKGKGEAIQKNRHCEIWQRRIEAIQNQILRKFWDFLCEILRFAESTINSILNFAPKSQKLSAKIAKSARFCVL
ncbi:hypothetical protein ACWIUD_03655 [Helicobacter sp. 23-1044]